MFDEPPAMAPGASGDDLRTAGAGWARAAELLESRADQITAGLAVLAGWDSPAGRAQADRVREAVAGMRANADVARYNHALLLAAADATDTAVRGLDAEGAPASDVVAALEEVYADVASRLTGPSAVFTPSGISGGGAASGSRGYVPATGAVPDIRPSADFRTALTDAGAAGAMADLDPVGTGEALMFSEPADRSASPEGDGPPPATEVSEGDRATAVVAGAGVPAPPRMTARTPAGGEVNRFPVTLRSTSVPVLRPTPDKATGRRDEDAYVDDRGNRVRIRWAGPPNPSPNP